MSFCSRNDHSSQMRRGSDRSTFHSVNHSHSDSDKVHLQTWIVSVVFSPECGMNGGGWYVWRQSYLHIIPMQDYETTRETKRIKNKYQIEKKESINNKKIGS